MNTCFKWVLGLSVCAVILLGNIMPVWADTDYRCLSLCLSGGKIEAVCMPRCSYDHVSRGQMPGETSKVLPTHLLNHRVLLPLQPIDNSNIQLNKQPAFPYRETKNYRCIAQCFHDKIGYGTCQRGCTVVTMKNGEAMSPGWAIASPYLFSEAAEPQKKQ